MKYSAEMKLNSLQNVAESFCFNLKKQSEILSLASFSLVLTLVFLKISRKAVFGFSSR